MLVIEHLWEIKVLLILMNNYFNSLKVKNIMALAKGNVIKEVMMTSKHNCTVSGCCLEFLLPENINFGNEKKVYVGVQNMEFPQQRKKTEVTMFFGHVLDAFDETKLKKYNFIYKSMEDLCLQIECCCLESIVLGVGSKIDYRSLDYKKGDFIVNVNYIENKIVMRKDSDYVLVCSSNLADLFKVGKKEKKEIANIEYWSLPGVIYSSDEIFFDKVKDKTLHFMVSNLIESCTVLCNGYHYPLLYSYKTDKMNNEINLVRLVSVPFFRCLSVRILNSNFEEHDLSNYDLINEPISFSLMFFN